MRYQQNQENQNTQHTKRHKSRMMMFITAFFMIHAASSMKLRGLIRRDDLNGKTVIRCTTEPIKMSLSEQVFRIPLCVVNDEGMREELISVRMNNIDGVTSDILADIYQLIRAVTGRDFSGSDCDGHDERMTAGLSDAEKLDLVRDGDHNIAVKLLRAMTVEELDAKQSFVKELGTILYQRFGGGEKGYQFLSMIRGGFEGDNSDKQICIDRAFATI